MTASKMSEKVARKGELVSDNLVPVDSSFIINSVDEILAPLETIPAVSDGFDFTSVLNLLGEAYSKKLSALRKAEEQALKDFHETYQQYISLTCGSKTNYATTRSLLDQSKANIERRTSNRYSLEDSDYDIKLTPEEPVIDRELQLSSRPYKELSKIFPEVFETKKSRELWQKKITVPEPFNMTIRDEEKIYKKRNSVSFDSADTSARFHSNPVPAHVHLPMYHLITEQSEKFRQERIDNRKQKLLAQVKPFQLSFANKPIPNKVVRSQSLTNLNTRTSQFSASPFPQHLFEESTKNKNEISENLRQVRVKARAEEMYKRSSSPFSQRRPLRRWNSYGSLNSNHQAEQKSSAVSKSGKHKIVPTTDMKSRENRHANCIPNYQPSAVVRPRLHVASTEEEPVSYKMTKSAVLRQAKRQKEEEILKQKEEQEMLARSNRKAVQMQLQKEVALKIKMHNQIPCSEDTIRQKLASHRLSQRNRINEHSMEMKDMLERLKKRPLLIEQQVQKASRDAAARHLQSGKIPVAYLEDSTKENAISETNSTEHTESSGSEDELSEEEEDSDDQTSPANESHASNEPD